jgi:hypothetical protein
MRSLKLLVVVMGVLLVGGTVALVAAVVMRGRSGAVAALARPPAATVVALPAGARVVATEMSGDRLLVRLALAQGGEQLVIFNLATGARITTIELRPADATGEAGR